MATETTPLDTGKAKSDGIRPASDLADLPIEYVKRQRFILGVAYMLSMGVCGIVLVGECVPSIPRQS